MILDKTHFIVFVVGAVLGLLSGFFSGKAIYDKPIEESVTRDTVTLHDTIPDIAPTPKDSVRIKWATRWLPVKPDTITQWETLTIHDSVAVEVPITSKHYSSKDYDAWVSGFEPSLDSIKVYKETQVITETMTRTVKDNKHFFLDAGAGCEYKFDSKTAVPFAEVGARMKFGRFGIGAYGGYSHDTKENKGLPYGKAKITYDIISF
jgi:hypothetical protein